MINHKMINIDNRYCDNILIENNREYKLEKVWRSNKTDKLLDSKGKIFPYPKENDKYWPDKDNILVRLNNFEIFLDRNKKFIPFKNNKSCLICGKKNVSMKNYKYNNIIWEDGLNHYIDIHNIEPSVQFKQFILNKSINKKINNLSKNISSDENENILSDISQNKLEKNKKMLLSRVIKDDKEFVMIDRNQMLILDALMIHGGYEKKYVDLKDNFNRYSEHAGFLDFEGDTLSKIIVSGKTTRIDEGDEEIYLPMGLDEMFEYEYIFHTHPPTPKPGGRAVDGILYEFPSCGDIYHFIDHHNDGNVIGSLVVTAEGLYNIRKINNDIKDIKIDEDNLYKKYQRTFNKIQRDAINEYGIHFTTSKFYSVIAQNVSYINKMNTMLNTFKIHIDYYPRKKDIHGRWIIDTIFLVFRDNKPK